MLNIDRFKDVNDSLGHEWGDVLLVGVGERIEALLRDGDTVARSGSDEFLVMFSEVADASEAASVADRILEALRRPWRLGNARSTSRQASGWQCFRTTVSSRGAARARLQRDASSQAAGGQRPENSTTAA